MFYQPGVTEHGLPYDPFKACVVPRPIGWIGTRNDSSLASNSDDLASLDNLAPYSQFTNVTFSPPTVMFSANMKPSDGLSKDSARNAERTGEFTWSLATWDLREAVNSSAEQVAYGVDEFKLAGVTKEFGQLVKAPMVKESPVKFECKYLTTLRIPGDGLMGSVDIIVGRVVGVHIDDSVLTNGKIDIAKTQPIARLGYYDYAVVRETFEMMIPGDPRVRAGLEGSAAKNEVMQAGVWSNEIVHSHTDSLN
ncbi:hypothetical protein OIO90_001533 [Microbotryomycetes sp. JL221]|nr:hypothetical protein OIO90_001533 [Microbotryomycetes sp. JL221]